MRSSSIYGRTAVIVGCILTMLISVAANAGTSQWVGGQSASESGASFIQISGTTITLTAGSSGPSYLNFGSGNEKVLGISGVWVVSSTGTAISGVTNLPNGCTISGSGKGNVSWSAMNSPTGYAGSNGYGSNGNWVQVSDSTSISKDGKTASGYTKGIFTCYGIPPAQGIDIGVDYLCDNGHGGTTTGRAYFKCLAVPETNSALAILFGSAIVAGLGITKRKQQAKASIV